MIVRPGGLLAVLGVLLALCPSGAPGGTVASAALALDYRLPPRYGLDANHDGLVDSMTTPAQVSPARWTALVTVRWPGGGPCLGAYRWSIGGRPVSLVQQRNPTTGLRTCTFAYSGFTQLDRPYRLGVTAKRLGSTATGRTNVTIRDLLIVGLGDSTASGEGNPDHGFTSVRWQDRRCHRSARGFEALVAARIEAASAKSSVTYVPLACSGASIATGMLRPYAGIVPSGGAPLAPQVEAMKALIGPRRVDAVLLSVGINDLGFGNIARFCFDDGVGAAQAAAVDCWSRPYPTSSSSTTLQVFVRSRQAALPGRFAQLAAALQAAAIPASKIFATEYPNATRDEQGAVCNPLIPYQDSTPFGFTMRGTITRAEAAQAETELLQPVNAAVTTAASTYGWRLVSGIASQSTTHGLCSTRPWFVGVSQSLVEQHDVLGTLHPNRQGHQAMAGAVVSALKP